MQYYWYAIQVLWSYATQLYPLKKKVLTGLVKELNHQIENAGFGPLSSKTEKRIYGYLIQSTFTNEWFSLLRGKPLTLIEKNAALYIGALTPLVDDLMDEKHYSENVFFQMESGNLVPSTSEEFAVVYCYRRLLDIVKNQAFFKESTIQVARAQQESHKQNQALSFDELERITRLKGGWATLYYRSILEHPVSVEEKECILDLGEILQLVNDAFDVYKDFHKKTYTLPLLMKNPYLFKQLLEDKTQAFITQYQNLNYGSRGIKQSLLAILLVVSRGEVCLNQHIHVFRQKGTPSFQVDDYTRKELVCDMEMPQNFLKSILIAVKWAKRKKI